MQSIQIKSGQTNLDISLMAFGTIERVMELPNLANNSLTADLTPGEVIDNIPDANYDSLKIAKVMKDIMFLPASGLNTIDNLGGIGYMEIGKDFKVN